MFTKFIHAYNIYNNMCSFNIKDLIMVLCVLDIDGCVSGIQKVRILGTILLFAQIWDIIWIELLMLQCFYIDMQYRCAITYATPFLHPDSYYFNSF